MQVEIKTKKSKRYTKDKDITLNTITEVVQLIMDYSNQDAVITIITQPNPIPVDDTQTGLPFDATQPSNTTNTKEGYFVAHA